jgi:redox-sensitive bicupin YhaK (pirin superfamily)
VERREALVTGAALASASLSLLAANAYPASSFDALTSPRSAVSVDSHAAIPVWPSWAGGRVIPMSLGGALQDPFLLLAHHDHWFDPKDPLRQPFKAVGKALGLPYVDVEGFKMHPHRGFDIWTYVLDGSDGFRHRDSLGGVRTYRGGSAQWMRTGSGVLHEEFWETNPDRRTNIELFQLWVNLPATHKFDPPATRYLGQETESEWLQHDIVDPISSRKVGTVRNLGATLDRAIVSQETQTLLQDTNEKEREIGNVARQRPPVQIMHVKIDPGARWTVEAPLEQSALVYVRKGSAFLCGLAGDKVLAKSQQTATFGHNGGTITIENASEKRDPLDLLLLMALPLQEPVVQAGPIVMNSAAEVNDAYQQLSDGTFLDRGHAMRQQQARTRSIRS